MSGDELSLTQAIQLLNSKRSTSDKEAERWPNPHRDVIQYAIKLGKEDVTLDGQRFTITYEGEIFKLSPVKGFVPCGRFNVRDFLERRYE